MENRKPTMQNAQARADQIQAFDLELTELTNNSVIMLSEQQNQSIQSYHHDVINALKQQYNIDDTAASKQLSLGMKIASLVAALALASSMFFLFFQFSMFSKHSENSILHRRPVIWGHFHVFSQTCWKWKMQAETKPEILKSIQPGLSPVR